MPRTMVLRFFLVTVIWVVALADLMSAQAMRFPELEKETGCVVLLADVRTGRIVGGVRTDLAFTQQYVPASVFKLAIAVAALQSGQQLSPAIYRCTGSDTIGGHIQKCWLHKGHDTVNFVQALAQSCNLYFRQLARRLPDGRIIQAARSLGMLTSSGFRRSSEPETVLQNLNDTTLLGEGFTVSPAQMLRTALILASGGRLSVGHYRIDLTSPRYRLLYRALELCITEGTGEGAQSIKFTSAGKTGTQLSDGVPGKTIGWYIGYAPARHPRYAVAVLQAGARGKDAAVIARKVLEKVL